MNLYFFKSCFIAALLLWLTGLTPSFAANQLPAIKPITAADIQQKKQILKDKQNLSNELKARILQTYDESLDNLKEANTQETQADLFKQSMSSLPLEIRQLTRQIAEAEADYKNRKPEKFAIFPTDELEQRSIIEKSNLSDLDAEISRLESQINEEITRSQLIREKIAEIKSRLAISQNDTTNPAHKSIENIIEKEGLQISQDSRLRVLNSTLKALEMENISGPLRLQYKKDRMNLLSLQREQLNQLIADLDNFLLERRQQEIDKEQMELLQAEKAAAGKHPLIQDATRENMQLNLSLRDINKNMERFLAEKNDLDVRYKQLEKDFQSAEQKISLAGLSPALGNLLREQRRNLPQRKQYNDLNDKVQNEIARSSLESFKLEETGKNLTDIGQALLSRINNQLSADLSENDKLRIRTELRMLLNDQKDLVLRLTAGYGEYTRLLGDVDFSLQQMLTSAEKFSAYLDQRLLWVPSAPIIDKNYPKDILKSLRWFISPSNWEQVTIDINNGILASPWVVLIGLGVITLLWRLRGMTRKHLQIILTGNALIHYNRRSFIQTLNSLFYILLLSLPGPLLMVWIGGAIMASGTPHAFSHSFATGLFSSAVSFCAIQFFYRLFKPGSIAEYRFQWQPFTTNLLFSQLKWSRFVLVPCIFMTAMTGSDIFSDQNYTLGRTALIIMMLALVYIFHRYTHPMTGLGKDYYQKAHGWNIGFGYLLYAIALLTPLTIIGFAVNGYYQSALELAQKLVFTIRLIFITVLLHEVAQRWLEITKRQLALMNARQKRKQEAEATAIANEGGLPIVESLLDIARINQQSHKLLTTLIGIVLLVGLWIIWRDILPAFSVFDRIVLWQHTQMLDSKEVLQPIVLTNLMISLAYAGLTYVFAANFPAMVDLLSVGKYEMKQGSRYALIQLVRYVLISIAFLAIANELGGSWSQVQWLVAALSVGLGFGLQEIFANMVSGIILLFERPIRVGDTVTIGDVTGRVTRIQMRATHIVDYDRKELVVPNKMFITDRLINWTLSDTMTRIVIKVGIAYGTQVNQVVTVIKTAIQNTPQVLHDPQPKVLISGFGDSAIEFTIYVYLRELTERLEIRHCLHKNIYEALQANQIEMPFPQQDLHIRSGSLPPELIPASG